MPKTKIGTRFQVIPLARIVTMVVIRLTLAMPVEKANTMIVVW